METNELIINDDNKLIFLNERLQYSGLYVAINEETNEGYVGMTEQNLKRRIKCQINNGHSPEIRRLFNRSNTRLHIVTFEPVDFEYADLFLYEDMSYDEYYRNIGCRNTYSMELKKAEYEFYRFMQSKGFEMLNKERGFSPIAKNNYEHGYSEELVPTFEYSLKKDNLFDSQVKNFLFPCTEDEKFMDLKMQHIELQIEFNKMKKEVNELKIREKDLNSQLKEVNLLHSYIQNKRITFKEIKDTISKYEDLYNENRELRAKIKQVKALLR